MNGRGMGKKKWCFEAREANYLEAIEWNGSTELNQTSCLALSVSSKMPVAGANCSRLASGEVAKAMALQCWRQVQVVWHLHWQWVGPLDWRSCATSQTRLQSENRGFTEVCIQLGLDEAYFGSFIIVFLQLGQWRSPESKLLTSCCFALKNHPIADNITSILLKFSAGFDVM